MYHIYQNMWNYISKSESAEQHIKEMKLECK